MRLAAKLILLFLVGLSLIAGLFSYLTIQQDQRLAIIEHEQHAADIAASLKPSIEQAIGKPTATELARTFDQSTRSLRHVRVRWVEFSAGSDRSRLPSVPMEMIVTTREITTVSMPNASGQDFLYTYLPVESTDEKAKNARIEISAPDPGADDRLRRSLRSSLIALLGVTTLSGLVIFLGGIKMVGEPLNRLIDKVHRVGRGDFSQPVVLSSNDELGKLGTALNEMCGQLNAQRERIETEATSRLAAVEQLRRAERLNMVGRMAAGIAHEIGTPLNVVTGRAELIASGQLSDHESRSSALTIQAEAQRITKIIRELLDFARQSTPQRSTLDLVALIKSTVNLMEPLVAKHDATLEVSLPESSMLANVDPGQIQQVLTNLIINAAQAADRDGQVRIAISQVRTKPDGEDGKVGPYCKIEIRDNGKGLPDSERQHIFEPFFTTKDVGEGTGLGLSISHGIVQEHQGWIEVESELGVGSCFSILLPTADDKELTS
jgi:two-component system NtrC family sensor kinase